MEESLNWIYLVQDWDRWLAGVNAIVNRYSYLVNNTTNICCVVD